MTRNSSSIDLRFIFGTNFVIVNIELVKATESKMKKVIRSDYVAERKISKQPKIETSESCQDQKENIKTENPEPVNASEKS